MLSDQAERDLIATESRQLLFVEAGAGTGKTTVLVNRIVSMVTGAGSFDPVPMSSVAAITFTDKAAAELRNRVRAELNKTLQTASGTERDLVIAALGELDGAAVGTLHSFARRILAEHPVEAGLPPSFETLDEIASEVAFDERWEIFLSQLLSDESMRWPVGMLDAVGVTPAHLRDLALALNSNSDRLHWPAHTPESAPLGVARISRLATDLLGRRNECTNASTCKMYPSFGAVSALVERLANTRNDRERLRVLMNARIPKVGNKGNKRDWPDIADVRAEFAQLSDEIAGAVASVVSEALDQVTERLRAFTIEGVMHRRRVGSLEFHDLLTQARWLLRDSSSAAQVRSALAAQYQRLLLDEFQDTDPIQIELAQLIALPDGVDAASARPERLFFVGDPKQSIYRFRRADIAQYRSAQQRLGDQLGSVLTLSTNFRTLPGIIDWVNDVFGNLITEVAALQPPYRALTAGRQLPDAVRAGIDEGAGMDMQRCDGPRVSVLGLDPHARETPISAVREAESQDVAGAIEAILGERWMVIDPDTSEARPAGPSDIAVLIPKRTGLPQLEDALSDAGISYRLEAASFVWRTQMVRDLMMCLRAVSDPTDALAVASALRTPVYGCGDDDLYLHRAEHHGSWNYTDPRLGDGELTPAVEALRHLLSLHQRSATLGPAAVIDALVRERRLYEQVATRARPRDGWRQIRYLADQARAWSDSQHGGMRGFLAWARGQAAENSRATESILPESDDEAVRVMTIHAAKGLEFPIVIVAGLQDRPRRRSGVQVIISGDGSPPEIRLRSDVSSRGFEERNEDEVVALHYERLRLLYVACTRARDHLIVSVHRNEPPQRSSGDHNLESGELLSAALTVSASPAEAEPLRGLTWRMDDFRPDRRDRNTYAYGTADGTQSAPDQSNGSGSRAEPVEAVPDPNTFIASREAWRQRHATAVQASRTLSHLSASALAKHHAAASIANGSASGEDLDAELDAAGMSKDDVITDTSIAGVDAGGAGSYGTGPEPLVRRGRYGTALGSAVHAVLQSIDLADTSSHDSSKLRVLADICARDHGLAGHASEITRRVEAALASRTVAEAARGRFWQEVFVTAPLDDGLVLEGFIDLLYETPEGRLVVVDFKTDAIADSGVVEQKTGYYRLQGASYAWCAQQATGMEVERVVFQFLTRDGVVEGVIEGEDLARALDEVAVSAYSARGGGW
jgi:ATP-dependent exoDNAse (exonuclease V) beta subunit